jgi:hypothetical protein
VESVAMGLEVAAALGDRRARKLLKAAGAFHPCRADNAGCSPADGERYRQGARISPGFVESTGDQVVRKRFGQEQPRPWTTYAAHLPLHLPVKTVSHEFVIGCRRWHPNSPVQPAEARAA